MNRKEMREKFFQYEVRDGEGNFMDTVYIEKATNWDTSAETIREALVVNYNYPEDITLEEIA